MDAIEAENFHDGRFASGRGRVGQADLLLNRINPGTTGLGTGWCTFGDTGSYAQLEY